MSSDTNAPKERQYMSGLLYKLLPIRTSPCPYAQTRLTYGTYSFTFSLKI